MSVGTTLDNSNHQYVNVEAEVQIVSDDTGHIQ